MDSKEKNTPNQYTSKDEKGSSNADIANREKNEPVGEIDESYETMKTEKGKMTNQKIAPESSKMITNTGDDTSNTSGDADAASG